MSLAAEKYVALTTFTQDGTPKPTAVWPVDAGDGRLGFITASDTWKVKRLANDDRVEVQPSDSRGRPKEGTSPRSGTAEVIEGDGFETLRTKVDDKYGFQVTLINGVKWFQQLIGRGGQANDRGVIVTFDEADGA